VTARAPIWRDQAPAAVALAGGRVLLLPTDTLPGLHGRADRPATLRRIAVLKGRDADRPFLLLAASVEAALQLGAPREDCGRAYLYRCWPGPVTIVLPCRRRIPSGPRFLDPAARPVGGISTVAVRVPKPDWLRSLVLAAGGPLVSTSANRSGEKAPSELGMAWSSWRDRVDGVWDPHGELGDATGACESGSPAAGPSALIDLTGWPPRVIRPGPEPPPAWSDLA